MDSHDPISLLFVAIASMTVGAVITIAIIVYCAPEPALFGDELVCHATYMNSQI